MTQVFRWADKQKKKASASTEADEGALASGDATAGHEVEDRHNQRNHEQCMDDASAHVERKAKQPQYEKNRRNR
jgi:hypothetical protein